jgi:hypothetical protein
MDFKFVLSFDGDGGFEFPLLRNAQKCNTRKFTQKKEMAPTHLI